MTIFDKIIIKIIRRLWTMYSTDKKELYRTDIKNGEPLFTADRFLFWLINYENDHKKQ